MEPLFVFCKNPFKVVLLNQVFTLTEHLFDTYLNTLLSSKFIEFQEVIVVWVRFVFGNVSVWAYLVLWRADFLTVSKNQKDPCLK